MRHDQGPHHPGPHQHGTGWKHTLRSLVVPHRHDPFGHVHPELQASAGGIRAVKISLVGLIATAAIQMVVVVATGSVALLSDTLHNLGDALTSVPLWIAFRFSRRQANTRYTYGYGRIEDLAGISVVVVIAVSAAVAAYESIDRLINPREIQGVGLVLAAGAVGFLGNELVAIYRISAGRRIGSAALVADGLHARTDGLTSLAVVLGGLGVAAGWRLADPMVGLLIAVAILTILKNVAVDIYHRLVDAVDPRLVEHIRNVLASVEGVRSVEEVRVRWIGHELQAEAQIGVHRDLSVADGHAVAVRAHHRLLHRVHRLTDAYIHVHPFPGGWEEAHAEMAHHLKSRTQADQGMG
jgi:cation diffusion facilitator family transporter